ncbi:MAG: Methyltransferase type 11 [Clostridiaceae bacterium]|jgi:2-polyprenyl-3-methyl-5-hydroxy-6-metoxy-1,4-benzoquinol methylase|nr:Methyltransferase type 11 [Clostridiaceae bacterium]
MSNVANYYENTNEDIRLNTTNSRKVEFTVTTKILDQYIKPRHKILELGAGTGVYSFYYAEKGNQVLATDITPKHIEIINEKLKATKNKINLTAETADAVDLSKYESESFDVVTCLGPLYHVTEEKLREKCIQEALRVLKKDGILAIAYINKYYVLHHVMLRDKSFLSHKFIDKILNTGTIKEGEKECFWTDAFFTTPEEMESFIQQFDVQIVDHAGTDGLNPFLRDYIDGMNDDEYAEWIYYTLKSCREKSILGMSNHGLLVCKKNCELPLLDD